MAKGLEVILDIVRRHMLQDPTGMHVELATKKAMEEGNTQMIDYYARAIAQLASAMIAWDMTIDEVVDFVNDLVRKYKIGDGED